MAGRRRIGEERLYYSPPAMRKYNQQQQQQQQLKSKSKSSPLPERRGIGSDSDDGAAPSKTNLDRFLEHTTPAVVAQRFPTVQFASLINQIFKDNAKFCSFCDYFLNFILFAVNQLLKLKSCLQNTMLVLIGEE